MALFTALLWAVTVIVASAAVPTTGAEAACLIDADTGRIINGFIRRVRQK